MLTLADTGDPIVESFRGHWVRRICRAAGRRIIIFSSSSTKARTTMASTTVFPIGDGQSWVVGAFAPESDFLAGVWRTRRMALAIAAAAALVPCSFAAALMAQHISRPVQALITFANRVGAGDLEAPGRSGRRPGVPPGFHGGSIRCSPICATSCSCANSLEVAMEVQKSLLPERDPISPRLDVAGRSKYCDQTGGDCYVSSM